MKNRRNTYLVRLVLIAFLALSFLFSAYSIFFRSTSPRMSLGRWGTDHISHPHATILIACRGLDVYRYPVEDLVKRDRSESTISYAKENDLTPNEDMDWFQLPQRRKPQSPVFLNWPKLARVYPPGLYVYCLPEAIALEFTDLPLRIINALTLVKFSLVAHVLLWIFMIFLLRESEWDSGLSKIRLGLLIVLFLTVHVQICLWTLSGFYDGLAVLFLLLLVVQIHRKGWAEAIFFFALAVFFHYRALWYAPPAAYAAFQIWQAGLNSIAQSRRQIVLLLTSGALLIVSGGIFVFAYPSMTNFPLTNEWHLTKLGEQERLWLMSLVAGVLICLLIRREWLLLACAVSVLFFLFNTRQLQYWHSLFLVPLILCGRNESTIGLLLGGMTYVVFAFVFFQLLPIDPAWARLYFLG